MLFLVLNDVHGVTGDHQLFIRSDESDLHLGLRERDHSVDSHRDIGIIIELHSQIGEVFTYPATQTAVVFSDTTGKDDEVDTVHCSCIGTNELGDIICKFLESKLSLRVALVCGIIKVTGIRRHA